MKTVSTYLMPFSDNFAVSELGKQTAPKGSSAKPKEPTPTYKMFRD